MSWDGRHADCVCTKSAGDSANCAMHAAEYEQRQAGCSCWAGREMPDGTRVDPGCDAEEWHNRAALKTPSGAVVDESAAVASAGHRRDAAPEGLGKDTDQ